MGRATYEWRKDTVVIADTCSLIPSLLKQQAKQVPSSPEAMASERERSNPPPTESGGHQSSVSDIFSSAQVLGGAARSALGQDGSQVDKAKVAKAGEELLDAVSEYGKLEEKGYGSYVVKAEGFIHQFGSSSAAPEKASEGKQEQTKSDEQSGGGLGAGVGSYFKVAKGLFK